MNATGGHAAANEEMVRSQQERTLRTAAERRRRHMVRLLDLAIDQCERRMLTASPDHRGQSQELRPPELALALIGRLQLELDGVARPPHGNQDALDVLFRLQRAYLPNCDHEDHAPLRVAS